MFVGFPVVRWASSGASGESSFEAMELIVPYAISYSTRSFLMLSHRVHAGGAGMRLLCHAHSPFEEQLGIGVAHRVGHRLF